MRTRAFWFTLAGALLLVGVAALLPLVAESGDRREIRIVSRQMAFFVAGNAASNPTIRVRPGERVRLTLINEDRGVAHDLVVPAWAVATSLVDGRGRASIDFTAPLQPGPVDYVCSRHVAMMTGRIDVVPSALEP